MKVFSVKVKYKTQSGREDESLVGAESEQAAIDWVKKEWPTVTILSSQVMASLEVGED